MSRTGRPGELLRLLRLLRLLVEQNVNAFDVEQHRTEPRLPIQRVEAMLTLETRHRAHCEALSGLLRAEGFTVAAAQPHFGLTGETRYPGV